MVRFVVLCVCAEQVFGQSRPRRAPAGAGVIEMLAFLLPDGPFIKTERALASDLRGPTEST